MTSRPTGRNIHSGPHFELRSVCVQFGSILAINDCDVAVNAGERVALIGPSGAGKSTLIGLLNGSVAATTGSVRALGCDYDRASARELRRVRSRIGTIYQSFNLVEELAVVHNVNAGRLGQWPLWRSVVSLLRPLDVDPVRDALDRVGIGDKLHQRTSSLSGGQKQRVAIARVLLQEPLAVMADEPIASLDPRRGREVIDLLHRLSGETGTTLVASLHDVDIALGCFDRVIGLREGRIAFDCCTAEVDRGALEELYRLDRVRSGS